MVSMRTQNLCHRQKGSGLDATVSSEDHVLAVNQDRIGEAEDPDAVGDLPDLFARMSARVAPIGLRTLSWRSLTRLLLGRRQNYGRLQIRLIGVCRRRECRLLRLQTGAILLRSLIIALALLAGGFRTVAMADAGGNLEQCEQANAHSEAFENCVTTY